MDLLIFNRRYLAEEGYHGKEFYQPKMRVWQTLPFRKNNINWRICDIPPMRVSMNQVCKAVRQKFAGTLSTGDPLVGAKTRWIKSMGIYIRADDYVEKPLSRGISLPESGITFTHYRTTWMLTHWQITSNVSILKELGRQELNLKKEVLCGFSDLNNYREFRWPLMVWKEEIR